MLNWPKKKADTPGDVKTLRQRILDIIKNRLRKWENEGQKINSIHLYLDPGDEEKNMYESAVYVEQTESFKSEIQRLADDYDLGLPATWSFEVFWSKAPDGVPKDPVLPVAVQVMTRAMATQSKPSQARITVLVGTADDKEYIISSTHKTVYIGREKQAQAATGFFRINTVAFNSEASDEANRSVSRQHAHIKWNKEYERFELFADEGGIPPKNKLKVQQKSGAVHKLQTTSIAHVLENEDQIMLGEKALLLFEYIEQ